MSTTTTADEIRAQTRARRDGVAGGWEQHADYVETRGAHVTELMLARTAPRPGERVLELASGAGDIAIAAAPLVVPGEVVVSDVAAELVDIAARRAAARGLANVTPRVFGVEAIDDEDASYDVVLCREGLMFAVDPELAAREIARVLRPAGRTALAVWGPRAQNPWLGCVFDAVSAQFERPMPPPGIPGPFALSEPGRLEQLLAGELEAVEVEKVAVTLIAASFDGWWSRVSALAGPLSSILGGMSGEAQTALRGRLEDAVLPYRTADGGLSFPGVSLLASGRRAG